MRIVNKLVMKVTEVILLKDVDDAQFHFLDQLYCIGEPTPKWSCLIWLCR